MCTVYLSLRRSTYTSPGCSSWADRLHVPTLSESCHYWSRIASWDICNRPPAEPRSATIEELRTVDHRLRNNTYRCTATSPAKSMTPSGWVIVCNGNSIWRPTRRIIGHSGLESFQAIDCTGRLLTTRTITRRKYTKDMITTPNTNKLALVKTQKKTHKT